MASEEHTILKLCREAWIIFFDTKYHTLPLTILEEASHLYINSGLIHRVKGEIYSEIQYKIKDKGYDAEARASAKQATLLSPDSIGHSLFYLATLITHDLTLALEEGQRGLAIENPIDPALEDFSDAEHDFKTLGERVGFMRRSIRDIVSELNKNDLGNAPDDNYLSEFLQKVGEKNKAALDKANAARKVLMEKIPDHPKWKIPQKLNVFFTINKEIIVSHVFVRLACKESIRVLKTEGLSKGLKFIDEVRFHNKYSALVHYAKSELFYEMYNGEDKDKELEAEYLSKAGESLEEAVRLCPDSIEFAMQYTKVLYLSKCSQDCLRVGERALAIQNPIDPAEQYVWEFERDNPTRQDRIAFKRQLVQEFVEVCRNILYNNPDKSEEVRRGFSDALVSKQKNTLDQDTLRLIPVEQIPDYPYLQCGSEEERRQKIAALVAIGNTILCLQDDSFEEPESEKLLSYWKSMSVVNKRDLLKLSKDDLFAHFPSKSTRRILSEAFAFYETSKSWIFRGCFCCDKKFATAEEHSAHTMKEHVGSLSSQQDSYMSTEIDDGWEGVVERGVWYAYEASDALRILDDKLELKPSTEEEEEEEEEDVGLDDERTALALYHLFTEKCPKSGDAQRISALENVETLLKSLRVNEFLSAEHVKVATGYGMDRLEVLFPDFSLWDLGLHQTHLCICLLDLAELTEILRLLEEIRTISTITEMSNIPKAKALPTDIEEIDLDGNSLCLLLDENFISPPDDSPDEDAVLKAMFQPSSDEEELEKWAYLENNRKQQGKELQKILKKNVTNMKKWCDQKSGLLRSQKVVEELAELLNCEFVARKESTERVPQSYEAILQKQQEETERAIPGKDRKSRLDVLKQALSEDYNPEEILAVVGTKISELEMYEVGTLENPTPVQQADNRIKEAVQRIAKSTGLKILKADAKTMHAYKENKKLEPMLDNFSGADYRTIVLPLVKLCISAKLEKQANTAVQKKSDGASDGNQAHISTETKKNANEKGNQSKKKQNKKGKDATDSQSSTDKKEDIDNPDDNGERLKHEAKEDGRKKAHLARKEREAAQQEGTAGFYIGSLFVRIPPITTATVQPDDEAAQQEDTTGLTAATTESTDAAATGGSSAS